MFIFPNRLVRLVEQVRRQEPIPLRFELWNGQRFDLSPDPTVTVRIPRPSALRYFTPPDLGRLGEAYVEGRILVEGPIHDLFSAAARFARRAGVRSSGLRRFVRHNRARDRKAIEHHYDVSDDFYPCSWIGTWCIPAPISGPIPTAWTTRRKASWTTSSPS